MSTALVVAGICLVIGGLCLAALARRQFRTGAPWRGMALNALANVFYGGIVLAGLTQGDSRLGTVLVFLVAATIWTSIWLMRRDQSRVTRPRGL